MGPLPESTILYNLILSQLTNPSLKNLEKENSDFPNSLKDKELDSKTINLLIDKLQSELETRKDKLKHTLIDHESDLKERLQTIRTIKSNYITSITELADFKQSFIKSNHKSESNLIKECDVIEEELKVPELKLKQQMEIVEAVEYLKELSDLKYNISKSLNDKDYHQAIRFVLQLTDKISLDRVENHCTVVTQLKGWLIVNKNRMIGDLECLFFTVVRIPNIGDGIKMEIQTNNIEFKSDLSKGSLVDQIYLCLSLLDGSDIVIKTLKDYLIDILLKQSLLDPFNNNFQLEQKDLILKAKKEKDLGGQMMALNVGYSSIVTIFKFIKVNLPDSFRYQLIPKNYYKDVLFLIIRDKLVIPAIPTSRPLVDKFNRVSDELKKMEFTILELGWDIGEGGELNKFIIDGLHLYLDRKRDDLLSLARAILLDPTPGLSDGGEGELSFNTVFPTLKLPIKNSLKAASSDSISLPHALENLGLPLRFPRCQVPDTMIRLLTGLEATLEECIELDAISAKKLYLSTRNVIDLYLGLIPVRTRLLACPTTGLGLKWPAMLHNEAMYLGHTLLSLAFKYQQMIKIKLNYLDQCAMLIQAGQTALTVPLFARSEAALLPLHELGSNAFKDLELDSKFSSANDAMDQSLRLVQELFDQWTQLLPIKLLESVLTAHILDQIATHFITELLDLIDISEKDSYALHHLASILFTKITDLLPHTTQQCNVKSFNQLECLVQVVLIGKLVEIIEYYHQNHLKNKFTNQQLASLIEALFGQSQLRDEFVIKLTKS